MSDLKRVRKVINWLIFQEFASNERELAELIGYTKSSFSQLVNGKVPLSNKFIDSLTQIDQNINKVWVKNGVGDMFHNCSLIKGGFKPMSVRAGQDVAGSGFEECNKTANKRKGKMNRKDTLDTEILYKVDIQKIEIESLKRELDSKDKIIKQLINKLAIR